MLLKLPPDAATPPVATHATPNHKALCRRQLIRAAASCSRQIVLSMPSCRIEKKVRIKDDDGQVTAETHTLCNYR